MAQRVGRSVALLFHDRGTRRGEWSAARPGRTLPPGKTRYPFYRRLDGRQGRSGRAENLVPTGIRSRTVQPVAQSLYRLSYRAHNRYNVRNFVCFKGRFRRKVSILVGDSTGHCEKKNSYVHVSNCES